MQEVDDVDEVESVTDVDIDIGAFVTPHTCQVLEDVTEVSEDAESADMIDMADAEGPIRVVEDLSHPVKSFMDMTVEEIKKTKYDTLRNILRKYGRPSKGTKKDLVNGVLALRQSA